MSMEGEDEQDTGLRYTWEMGNASRVCPASEKARSSGRSSRIRSVFCLSVDAVCTE
jgi:hypothetical protein